MGPPEAEAESQRQSAEWEEEGWRDGRGKRHRKEEQPPSSSMFPFLPPLTVPNYSRLLLPTMFSSGHKALHHPQEQVLREIQSCFKSQGWPKTA